MMKRFMAIAVVAAIVSACSDAGCPPASLIAPVRDVPFYLANPGERAAQIAACRDNPAAAMLDANCMNARAAATRRATDPANKTMPKIDWKF